MVNETVYTLVISSNPGRYACDNGATGHDITTGEPIALLLAGRWVTGRVEHSGPPTEKYPDEIGVYSITSIRGPQIGYYFISETGHDVCGLCTGMKIKLRW